MTCLILFALCSFSCEDVLHRFDPWEQLALDSKVADKQATQQKNNRQSLANVAHLPKCQNHKEGKLMLHESADTQPHPCRGFTLSIKYTICFWHSVWEDKATWGLPTAPHSSQSSRQIPWEVDPAVQDNTD